MSVIVKGMKMPEDCRECPFENYHSDIGQTVCMASLRVLAMHFDTISFDGRHPSCPLVALPDKHGRLVDADELIKFVEDRYEITWESDCYEGGIKDACSDILEKIDTMPTIVEAEDSE